MKPANTNAAPGSGTLADVSRDVMIRVRVTEEDRERWQAAADADQRTLSDWLRIVANAASANVKTKRKKARS